MLGAEPTGPLGDPRPVTLRSASVAVLLFALGGCATRAEVVQQDRQLRGLLRDEQRQLQEMQHEVERLRADMEEGRGLPRGTGRTADDRLTALEQRINQLEQGGARAPAPPRKRPSNRHGRRPLPARPRPRRRRLRRRRGHRPPRRPPRTSGDGSSRANRPPPVPSTFPSERNTSVSSTDWRGRIAHASFRSSIPSLQTTRSRRSPTMHSTGRHAAISRRAARKRRSPNSTRSGPATPKVTRPPQRSGHRRTSSSRWATRRTRGSSSRSSSATIRDRTRRRALARSSPSSRTNVQSPLTVGYRWR